MYFSCIFPVYGLIGFFPRRPPPKTPFHPGSPRATLWGPFSFERVHIPQLCVQLTVTAPPSRGGQYPGLYLFSTRARMMRPVKYLANNRDDQVGSFEQVYMDIACTQAEIEAGVSTHVEHPRAS